MGQIRVLIADDHALVAQGLQRLLDGAVGFTCVGTVDTGAALIMAVRSLRPDVALVDLELPDIDGLKAIRKMIKIAHEVKPIMLTMHGDREYMIEALHAGARGYVLKQGAFSELRFAIEEVYAGRYYVTPALAKDLVGMTLSGSHLSQPSMNPSDLTPRQREVLMLIAQGRSASEIAHLLGISAKTVEFHKMKIKMTLGLSTPVDYVKYAVVHGLLQVPGIQKKRFAGSQHDDHTS